MIEELAAWDGRKQRVVGLGIESRGQLAVGSIAVHRQIVEREQLVDRNDSQDLLDHHIERREGREQIGPVALG